MEYRVVTFPATVNISKPLTTNLLSYTNLRSQSHNTSFLFQISNDHLQVTQVGCMQIFYGYDYKASATCCLSDLLDAPKKPNVLCGFIFYLSSKMLFLVFCYYCHRVKKFGNIFTGHLPKYFDLIW